MEGYDAPSYRIVGGRSDISGLHDTSVFLNVLCNLRQPVHKFDSDDLKLAKGLLRPQDPVYIARAPGRLDVMGGIADYSGSLVLQMPIQEACHVALQRQKVATGEGGVRIVSLHGEADHRAPSFEAPFSALYPGGDVLSYSAAREYFATDSHTHWAAYVAGCLLVLSHMKALDPDMDECLAVLVSSDVPEGKGVSSSAAVEVATMSALAVAYGIKLEGRELAILCQKVENLVVGAPCGIMDQMASALGTSRRLLALLCQPAELQGHVPLPSCAAVWGVDSGVRHSVGGSDYGSVRVGAFMGSRILNLTDHLANLAVGEFMQHYEASLPLAIKGQEFLDTYTSHHDTVTAIDASASYAVRTCAAHPVNEHFRVRSFRQLLLQLSRSGATATPRTSSPGDGGANSGGDSNGTTAAAAGGGMSAEDTERLQLMGELMFQSHASYGLCGLGSAGTDRLVTLVRDEIAKACDRGEPPALYGAKITGGGSGGTVAILGVAGEAGEAAVARVVERYSGEVKLSCPPHVFRGSSMGAVEFGHIKLMLPQE